MDRICKSKALFYLLSFTWGLPVSLAGCIIAFLFIISGHKPKRFGYCFYFETRHFKGGCSAGIFIFCCGGASQHMLMHEHGHGLQNCLYGVFMPFFVSIPSSTRYHYRNFKKRVLHKRLITPYESIWFEAEATKYGKRFLDLNKKEHTEPPQ